MIDAGITDANVTGKTEILQIVRAEEELIDEKFDAGGGQRIVTEDQTKTFLLLVSKDMLDDQMNVFIDEIHRR